jgi:Asp-tRNA(Asn)/Glu-tRNA(Gln) amidotransferase A subunit family amidase
LSDRGTRPGYAVLNGLEYDVRPVPAPRVRGAWLRVLTALLENPALRGMIAPLLIRRVGLGELRALEIDEPPAGQPWYRGVESGREATRPFSEAGWKRESWRNLGFQFRGIRDYRAAYESGAATPEQAGERALRAIAASDDSAQPLRAFIACDPENVMAQARESTERWKAGKPLGPLDGVPIAIKDELDTVPYPTTAGTRFLGRGGAREDATVVARLRKAGALIIGKANMHEIGILPDAMNAQYGPVRNPYGPAREAGGSSSGCAAAVAAGLCAAAIGADAGGSIRIPAGHCGVVGLKPAFGRVSEFGAVPLAWSVAHVGPIAATAEDAALVYLAITGPDPRDPNTQAQPRAEVHGFDGSLRGVRIGVFRDWFSDASREIAEACERLLGEFVRLGAEVVEVVIPELRLIAVAHGVTIHAEMAAAMERYDRGHRRDFSLTTRLMLANARALRSSDYVQAQRMRSRAIEHFRVALARADVIATPTTPITAPEISRYALRDRESNIARVFEVMRFVNAANLTGLPAMTIPAGYDSHGFPIGLQLIGRPWDEAMLFRLAFAAGGMVPRRRPEVWFDLLTDPKEYVPAACG